MKQESKTEWEKIKSAYCGKNVVVQGEYGYIDFSPQSKREVIGGENLTYGEYLDIQRTTLTEKPFLHWCYFTPCACLRFKGKVKKIQKDKGFILLEDIYGCVITNEGDCIEDSLDHTWMSYSSFSEYGIREGECISFSAEVYHYLKKNNGKQIGYSLRNPSDIEKIQQYELPSEYEILRHGIKNIYCMELCRYKDHCDGIFCQMPENDYEDIIDKMILFICPNPQKQRKIITADLKSNLE